ncbi:hypothetical protein F5050DRAFT_1560962 [Lentinula boryana]|uniref:Uncharacterized protein n=1 Tax=Lentinula boryana TaxID=40481 RepID=A0ABQ8QS68_9AGAR|nr:hypothetical protein F5050DRAFT_1560962 [Lentinula boryana]
MSLNIGHGIVTVTAVFFIVASYAILFSAILPLTGNVMLDALANDTHYKYFTLLIIPTGAYFVIANWVGWQYYRNS